MWGLFSVQKYVDWTLYFGLVRCVQQEHFLRREPGKYSVPFFWCTFWDIFNSFLLLKGRVFKGAPN